MSSKNGNKIGSTDKILITGASGFLGRQVAKIFKKKYPKVKLVCVSRKNGDLKNKVFWSALPKDFTVIIHLAAFIDWHNTENPKKVLKENLLPIKNLISFARKNPNLSQIIYSSSVSIYQPIHAYGRAKLEGEKELQKLASPNLKITCLRFSSLYGPGQYAKTVLPVMMTHALLFQKITIFGKGRRVQDFLNVKDAAKAIVLAYQNKPNSAFDVGYGQSYSMKNLAKTIISVVKNNTKIVFNTQKSEGQSGHKIRNEKAREFLKFYPKINLKQGLREIFESSK